MKRNLAQQAEDAEQLLWLCFSFFWQFWGGDVAGAVTWPYVLNASQIFLNKKHLA